MKPAAGLSAIRGPLASSSAERSRFATSRTAPRIVRAPIGGGGSRHEASRCRVDVTPPAKRTGPSCLAAKLSLYADRPEGENERAIQTVRHAGAEVREEPKGAAPGRAAGASNAGTSASRRGGLRARRHRPDHPAGQSAGTRFRGQCSHARAIFSRAEISPSLVSRCLADRLESIDLNRVFAIDLGAYSGMAKTESQLFHRQRYREAAQAAGKIGSHVLEWAVCREIALEQVGQTLGWNSRPQAYAAAVERMKTALDELCKLWGIGT